MEKTLEEYVEEFKEEKGFFLRELGFIPLIRGGNKRVEFSIGEVECSIDFETENGEVYGRFSLSYKGNTIEGKNRVGHDYKFKDKDKVLGDLLDHIKSFDRK